MLHSELEEEHARWERFNDDAAEAVRLANSEAFCAKIVARVDDVNRRWRQLQQALKMQIDGLIEARQRAEEFAEIQLGLRQQIRAAESALNDAVGLRLACPCKMRRKF